MCSSGPPRNETSKNLLKHSYSGKIRSWPTNSELKMGHTAVLSHNHQSCLVIGCHHDVADDRVRLGLGPGLVSVSLIGASAILQGRFCNFRERHILAIEIRLTATAVCDLVQTAGVCDSNRCLVIGCHHDVADERVRLGLGPGLVRVSLIGASAILQSRFCNFRERHILAIEIRLTATAVCDLVQTAIILSIHTSKCGGKNQAFHGDTL